MTVEASPLATTKLRSEVSERAPTRAEEPARRLCIEQVYAEHARFVFRVLCGMGVPDAHVDDAVQDVFIVVHQRLPDFDPRVRVTTWLFQIARRVALNYRRKGKRERSQRVFEDERTSGGRTPHDQAELNEAAEQLGEVLDELDEDKRALWILAELEDMTAPEIASVTAAPLNTVYTRLRRARAAFVALWNERRGAP